MSTLDQFIAFGTGSVGLERLLRGVEALAMILIASPLVLSTVLSVVPSLPPQALLIVSFSLLKSKLGIVRRTIRFFRFMGSFQSSYKLYTAPSPNADGSKGLEVWIDMFVKTSLGLYGLLETATILDVAQVEGLEIWGQETSSDMNREAQRFWFLALAGDIIVCVFHMLGLFSVKPVESSSTNGSNAASTASDETEKVPLSKEEELQKERLRLKGVLQKRKAERRAWMRDVSRKLSSLGWKIVSNTLDMALPAKALGWIDVSTATVGWLMLVSTFLTGREVWHRVGEEIRMK